MRLQIATSVALLLCSIAAHTQGAIPWTPIIDTGLVRTTINVAPQFEFLGINPAVNYVMLPKGWTASVYYAGRELNKPRFLEWGPDSILYVANMSRNNVLALLDDDVDGIADRSVVAAQTSAQCGDVKFNRDTMYTAAEAGVVKRWRSSGDGLVFDVDSVLINKSEQPNQTGGNHRTRTLVIDTVSQTLFLSVGSKGNADRESDRALIEQYQWDGTGRRVFARGVRNAVGMTLHPETGRLWANNNGSDLQGNDVPPEWVDIVREDGFYGYPFAYHVGNWFNFTAPGYGDLLPLTSADSADVRSMVPPAALVWAHCAPMELEWSHKGMPDPWRNGLFMVMRGSWNRSPVSGAKIVFFGFDGSSDTVANYMREFCTGFITDSTNTDTRWARPVGLALGADGSVYVSSDDLKQCILKFTPPAPVSVGESTPGTMSIQVRPNPAADRLTVVTNAASAFVDVIDATGQLVLQDEVSNGRMEMDVSSLAAGMYFVRVRAHNSLHTNVLTVIR